MTNVIQLKMKSGSSATSSKTGLKMFSTGQNAVPNTSTDGKNDIAQKVKPGKRPEGYASWTQMKQRCGNPKHRDYAQYGGRGITYASQWGSFDIFASDMGSPPSRNHSLDRIDPEGHYEPENCRWATKTEQTRNRRSTKRIEYQGKLIPLAELAQSHNIAPKTLAARLAAGYHIERALREPVVHGGDRRNIHKHKLSAYDVWPSCISKDSQESLERQYALRPDREQSRPEYLIQVTQESYEHCMENLCGRDQEDCDPVILKRANGLSKAREEARILRDRIVASRGGRLR